MSSVRTAVLPVAGLGTRFLPASKATPKVLLPILDRPLVQYAVDEAFASGIESIVFVTARGQDAIVDYFDMVAPNADSAFMVHEDKANLVALQRWSSDAAMNPI